MMHVPISVIVCTHNRVERLKRCIEALVSVHSDRDWELIVVDNNSVDGTAAYLSSLPRRVGQVQIVTTFEPKRGLSAAQNAGARLANGEILAFTDDDCYVRNDFIEAIIRAFSENQKLGVIG